MIFRGNFTEIWIKWWFLNDRERELWHFREEYEIKFHIKLSKNINEDYYFDEKYLISFSRNIEFEIEFKIRVEFEVRFRFRIRFEFELGIELRYFFKDFL